MERYKKFLISLQLKKREAVLQLMRRIVGGDLLGLDIKKLQGYEYLYRARKGDVRIIYFNDGKRITIVDIGFRKDIYRG